MRRLYNYLTNNRGVALMMVLWVMVFLTVIVTEFAFSMRTELKIMRNFKEEVQSYYLARAGIALALAEILSPEIQGDYAADDKLVFKLKGEATGYLAEGEAAPTLSPQRDNIPLGAGTVSYRIMDEDGKINLNSLRAGTEAQRQILYNLLSKAAGLQVGTARDIIVDSILDWMDKDDLHRMNGAEDDYYQGLDPGYDCKDGPFDTVDELLLVQGITKKILYGTEIENAESGAEEVAAEDKDKETYPGIARFLTVWGRSNTNNYSADPVTLEIKYGDEKAAEIKQNIASNLENPNFVPPKSSCFSIISTGKLADGSASRSIFAVVKLKKKNKVTNIEYQCWNDNLVKYKFTANHQ